jgi:hypothetical protein
MTDEELRAYYGIEDDGDPNTSAEEEASLLRRDSGGRRRANANGDRVVDREGNPAGFGDLEVPAGEQLSDVDAALEGTLIGGWSGSDAKAERIRAEREAARNRNYWEELTQWAPSADELAVDYAHEGEIASGDSAWGRDGEMGGRGTASMMDASTMLDEWARGGYTDADRAMMDENRRREGMGARADREANMSAMNARGMGGSGAALMGMMGAGEAAANRASAAESAMAGNVQDRAVSAASGLGSLGSAMRGDEARSDSATDAWNAWNTDYGRGVNQRNTDRTNQTSESRSTARQQAYDNRERAVAGVTGQYSTDSSRRTGENAQAREDRNGLFSFLGGIL